MYARMHECVVGDGIPCFHPIREAFLSSEGSKNKTKQKQTNDHHHHVVILFLESEKKVFVFLMTQRVSLMRHERTTRSAPIAAR
mmetsp:Transcript_13359/g.37490  ORF Transcript_13359/g.37490 Transcript_13359/m.37490 type:complete len:84 (+) Transcript_13359:2450-2701(+)